MIASLLFCGLLGTGLLGQVGQDRAPEERLREATAALDELRLEEAITLLEDIVADAGSDDRVRGEAYLSLGLARASLLDDTAARTAFAAALTIDPRATLPAGTSPKVLDLFDSTRAALLPNGVPPPRKPVPHDDKPPPAGPTPPPPTPAATEPAPAPARVIPPAADKTAWLVGGGVLVGASSLAGGAALLADASLADPTPLRTRAEYETTRSLGIAAFASSVVLGAAGVLVLVGSLSDEGAP